MDRPATQNPRLSDRILFVDDDETVRAMAEAALRSFELPFDVLGDGAEAWSAFQRHHHSLVFTDLQLPGISGEELLRRIKCLELATEVVVVTGYPSLRSAIDTFKGGAYDYLLKPIQQADLRRCVERCLQAQRLQRELTTEKMLRRKFEELCDLRTHFLANVSHELRTPLQVILGYADLLGESIEDQRSRGDLDSLTRNAQALSDIVDDLLMLTQIDAGRVAPSEKPTEVSRIVQECSKSAHAAVGSADLTVDCGIDSAIGLWTTDPELLDRLLRILLANSLKFTSEGRIAVHVEPSRDRSTLEITVSDTGIGIPEELMETVFEDFRQADGSSTRRVGGMGVGLALARRIVTLLGGNISASNREPHGTEFRVLLPARGQDSAEYKSEIGSEQR